MKKRAVLPLLCAALAATVLGACGNGGSPSAPGGARLIVAYPAGLTEVGLDGAPGRVLVPATKDGAPASPAVSPDGRSVAYLDVPLAAAAALDSGADLWVAGIDGKHRRLLLAHPSPGHSVRSPLWEDVDHLLVVIDRPATCDGCNPVTATDQTLERVDVRTGATTAVRRGVTSFDLSPGGGAIAYPDTTHESAAALMVAALGDSPPREVVPLSHGFAEITSMRFSPDGASIAFAAADRRLTRGGERLVSRAPVPLPAPDLDGLPENVWLVDASGEHLRLLASLREDQPSLVWSADGASLYVIGTGALYRIDVAGGGVSYIGRGAVHSQIALVAPAP